MRRDLPEGCAYAAYPSFGYGRILTAPRMARHVGERYLSLRCFGYVYVLIFGRYWERWSVSFVRWDIYVREPSLDDDGPDPVGVVAAMLAEDARLDAGKAANRAARRLNGGTP